jgi:hypothetical protein
MCGIQASQISINLFPSFIPDMIQYDSVTDTVTYKVLFISTIHINY